MSIRAINAVFAQSVELKGERLCVMLALADFCDEEFTCFPLKKTIAAKAHVALKSMDALMKYLKDNGYLEVIEPGGGGRKSHTYRIYPKGDRLEKQNLRRSQSPIPKGGQMTGDTPCQGDSSQGGSNDRPPLGDPLSQGNHPLERPPLAGEAYKEEPSGSFDKELTLNERDDFVSISPSPNDGLSEEEVEPVDLVREVIREVCGISEQYLARRPDREIEIQEVEAFLLAEYGGDEEAIVTAVRERYAPGIWERPKPPHLSQFEETWPMQGRILELRSQLTNEEKNGKNQINRAWNSPSHRGRQNAAERKSEKWDEWFGELSGGSGDSGPP